MKKRFHVKKRTLLLIAGIVWLIAGFNVARLLCQKTMRLVSSPFLYWIRLICAIIYCKINKTY